MNKLIKIEQKDGIETVSARELYEFLENKERFSKWFSRMLEFGFAKHIDYTPYQMVHPQNKQQITEYYITLDMAKELSMLSRSEKGQQARRYFIECEKKLKNKPLTGQVLIATALIEAQKIMDDQSKQIEQMKPAVDFYKAVTSSKDAIEMSKVAKVLNMGIGRNRLFELLRDKKLLRYNNEPFQKYIDAGYFRVVEQKYTQHGEIKISIKTLVYQKGLDYISRLVEV